MFSRLRLAALCAPLLLAACLATPPTAQVTVVHTPVTVELAGLRSLAVHPFERDGGEVFSRSLETVIANVAVTDKNQERRVLVTVVGVDRTRAIGRTATDPAALGAAARRLNVDAILVGEIIHSAASSQPYQDSRSVCAREVTRRDKRGREYQECASWRDVAVPCVRNTATVRVNYRVVSQKGEVVARKSAEATDQDHACEGKRVQPAKTEGTFLERIASARQVGGPVTPPAELLVSAHRQAAQMIKDEIVPQQKTLAVEWLSSPAGIADARAKEKFESGVKFAQGARADRACELFREAYVAEQQAVALHYNVGLCDEIDGLVDQAQRKYVVADRMLKEPNPAISAALKRTTRNVEAMGHLASKRGDVFENPGVIRVDGRPKVNPIAAVKPGLDPKMLDTIRKERRMALVIGNAQYRHVGALRNAGKDARDVESALKVVGFNVLSGYDLDHARTLQLLNRFRAGLQKGDVVVVYFAGHGISMANSNLLLPIDFEKAYARNPGLARQKAVDMEQSIATMLKGAGVRFSMIVADACREVPQLPADSRSIQRGLAAPREVASGTLILYAAGAGQTADDGPGDNGLFTSYFLQAIRTPNVNIRQSMEWVVHAVKTETSGQQVPSMYSEATGEFYFSVVD